MELAALDEIVRDGADFAGRREPSNQWPRRPTCVSERNPLTEIEKTEIFKIPMFGS